MIESFGVAVRALFTLPAGFPLTCVHSEKQERNRHLCWNGNLGFRYRRVLDRYLVGQNLRQNWPQARAPYWPRRDLCQYACVRLCKELHCCSYRPRYRRRLEREYRRHPDYRGRVGQGEGAPA